MSWSSSALCRTAFFPFDTKHFWNQHSPQLIGPWHHTPSRYLLALGDVKGCVGCDQSAESFIDWQQPERRGTLSWEPPREEKMCLHCHMEKKQLFHFYIDLRATGLIPKGEKSCNCIKSVSWQFVSHLNLLVNLTQIPTVLLLKAG